MIRIALAALAGALSPFLSPALADEPITDPADIVTVGWPENFNSQFHKLRGATLFERGSTELLALAGSDLYLVRDPMSAPAMKRVATGVQDFAVLPAENGLSRVVVVNASGLSLSSVVQATTDPTIQFAPAPSAALWKNATCVDAALDGNGKTRIAAGIGSNVRHVLYLAGTFQTSASFAVGQTVAAIAVADAHASAGAEIAVATSSGVKCFDKSGTLYRTIPSSYPISNLLRIPNGADVRDSFGFVVNYATYDTFHEVVGLDVSDPLYGAQFRVGSMAFAPLGIADTRTDMLFSCSNAPYVVALHGQPQGPVAAFPFDWDVSGWTLLGLDENEMPFPPDNPILGCGDFDGDGDMDLAMAGMVDNAPYVVFKRGLGREFVVTDIVVGEANPVSQSPGITGSTEVNISFTANVPQPEAFGTEQTGRVRVRIFARQYGPDFTESTIPSQWLAEEFFYVTATTFGGPYPVPIVFNDLDVSEFGADETLLYFELVPQLFNSTGGTTQRANATNWVGSANGGLLSLLICQEEPDPFSTLYPCYGGTPLITDVYRRRTIRPIQPTPAPQ